MDKIGRRLAPIKPDVIPDVDEITLAWTAGIVEGEGSFTYGGTLEPRRQEQLAKATTKEK